MPEDDPSWAQVAPYRDLLRDLIAYVQSQRDRRGHIADAESPAMAELALEHTLRGSQMREPVRTAHAYAVLCLAAAEDHLRAIVKLLSGDPAPMFGHIALAGAGLEACGRALWLGDPKLGARQRVIRVQTDRIYSAADATRMPGELVHDPEATKATILAWAEELGIKKLSRKRHPPQLEEERPGPTDVIRHLFHDEGRNDVGAVTYQYFSAVAHATFCGLTHALDRAPDASTVHPGLGVLKSAASDVNTVVIMAALGYTRAAGAILTLFGWGNAGWAELTARTRELTPQP